MPYIGKVSECRQGIHIASTSLSYFVFGMLELMGMIVIVLYMRRSRQLSKQGKQVALILPIYNVVVWYEVLIGIVIGLDSIFGLYHEDPIMRSVKWLLYQTCSVGVAAFLMHNGIGLRAFQNSLLIGLSWAVFTAFVPLVILRTRGARAYNVSVIVQLCLLLVFYGQAWLLPQKWLHRRPALIQFSRFYFIVLLLFILATSLTLSNFRYSPCLTELAFAFVDFFQPFVVLRAVRQDSKFWQGLYEGRGKGALSSPLLGIWEMGRNTISMVADSICQLERKVVPIIPFGALTLDDSFFFSGGNARVYKGMYKTNTVAIKILYCMELTPERVVDFCNEATMLNSLQHENIVVCYGVAVMPPAICLVTEFCDFGSLYDFLHNVDLVLRDLVIPTASQAATVHALADNRSAFDSAGLHSQQSQGSMASEEESEADNRSRYSRKSTGSVQSARNPMHVSVHSLPRERRDSHRLNSIDSKTSREDVLFRRDVHSPMVTSKRYSTGTRKYPNSASGNNNPSSSNGSQQSPAASWSNRPKSSTIDSGINSGSVNSTIESHLEAFQENIPATLLGIQGHANVEENGVVVNEDMIPSLARRPVSSRSDRCRLTSADDYFEAIACRAAEVLGSYAPSTSVMGAKSERSSVGSVDPRDENSLSHSSFRMEFVDSRSSRVSAHGETLRQVSRDGLYHLNSYAIPSFVSPPVSSNPATASSAVPTAPSLRSADSVMRSSAMGYGLGPDNLAGLRNPHVSGSKNRRRVVDPQTWSTHSIGALLAHSTSRRLDSANFNSSRSFETSHDSTQKSQRPHSLAPSSFGTSFTFGKSDENQRESSDDLEAGVGAATGIPCATAVSGSLRNGAPAPMAKFLPLQLRLKFARECCAGVAYLHANGFAHCDIKSLNFLVTKDLVVKLSDLGEARSTAQCDEASNTTLPRNINWSSPETLRGEQRAAASSDVWSLAFVISEILSGDVPFDIPELLTLSMEEFINKLREGMRPDLPRFVQDMPWLTDLLESAWDFDPLQRCSSVHMVATLESRTTLPRFDGPEGVEGNL